MGFTGPAKAVGYGRCYWLSGVLCSPGLAILAVCVYRTQGAAKQGRVYTRHVSVCLSV